MVTTAINCFWDSLLTVSSIRLINVDVTKKYIFDLLEFQQNKCALTGRRISIGMGTKIPRTASLDRIDSTKGYEEGNLQWVAVKLNQMKGSLSQGRFIELCKKVAMTCQK